MRRDIRAFAAAYEGPWRWQWWWQPQPRRDCRTFQDELLAAAGLVEDDDYAYTRGTGCPFMYLWRELYWSLYDLIHSRRRPPERKRLVAEVARATA